MAQFAYWSLSRQIRIAPGEVRMYRLPTMTPGEFHLFVSRVQIPPLSGNPTPPTQPSGPGQPVGPSLARRSGPARSVLGNVDAGVVALEPANPAAPPIAQPEDLLLDLFHGDELVVSGANALPLQTTLSEGDSTWRVRIQLAPGSPPEDYIFDINLNPFPSMLQILTRKVPLAFLQQGFDDNWNSRNYISIELSDNNFVIIFDPEIASYYNLTNQDFVLSTFPTLEIPNIRVSNINLTANSSPGPFGVLPGPLPNIRLTVSFTGIDNQPIKGGALGFSFEVQKFSLTVTFLLTNTGNRVGFVSEVASDLMSQLPIDAAVRQVVSPRFNEFLSQAQQKIDSYSFQVGAVLTPWLLGAAFDALSVGYNPANSQAVPIHSPQGDIVIEYVGQPAIGDDSSTRTEGANPPAVLTITTAAIPDGLVGTPYSQEFTAVAGTGALSWSATGIPPGAIFAGGKLNGAPSTPGVYNIQVTVRDASNAQASHAYTFAINTPSLGIATPQKLPEAVAGEPYAIALSAPVTSTAIWSATGLPPGLSLSTSGVISGTPSANGSLNTVAVKVTDSHGVPAFKAFSLTVREALLFPDSIYSPRGDGDSIWKPRPSARPRPGNVPLPSPLTTPGDLGKIDHIVVVMMENRSFDHMLGYLSREGGRNDVEGLKWETGDNRTQYNFYNGRFYYPELLTDTRAFKTEAMSPDHSHESVKAQMADGMMHFVSDYAKKKVGDDPALLRLVMGYYGAQQLPVYDTLAREFAICDHWFCSHLGPTWPNRFVTLTGDLNRDSYGEPEVNTPESADFTPSEATTLFDLLTARGVSWQYFQQRASLMRAFTKYSFDMTNVLEFDADTFKVLVKAGDLKSVTFIDPLFGDLPAGVNAPQDNDDAPPSDLKDGQMFISNIYETLFTPTTNPNCLKTMLIIVYDEHGGFYDHVEPPASATPLLGQNSGKLGPRVPAFVVSAWTPPGMVLKDTFDHTTIAATILRRFCSPSPPILSPRVTAALDLRGALSLARPRLAFSLQFQPNIVGAKLSRTAERRFKAPKAPDSYGAFLGGLTLTLGSTPR